MAKKNCSSFGFTLIELLVVISLISVFFIIGIASYMRFNRNQILEQAAAGLKNNLRLAQNMAATGEMPTDCSILDGYQISFYSETEEKDYYEIQAKCGEFLTGEKKSYYLAEPIRFNPLHPLPQPLFFKVLSQGTDESRTINLTGFGLSKTVVVSLTGEIK